MLQRPYKDVGNPAIAEKGEHKGGDGYKDFPRLLPASEPQEKKTY